MTTHTPAPSTAGTAVSVAGGDVGGWGILSRGHRVGGLGNSRVGGHQRLHRVLGAQTVAGEKVVAPAQEFCAKLVLF